MMYTTLHWALPPSPTLSSADSLADIDDLGAFLAAKGDLSRFPTPPLSFYTSPTKKDGVSVTAVELLDDDENDIDSPLEDAHVADVLSSVAGQRHSSTFYETVLIQDMLQRAQLPPEILGLALNILLQYNHLSTSSAPPTLIPADLLTVAAFVLATDFLQDHAPHAHFWSRHITWDVWPPPHIDATKMYLLQALDWKLLHLATPLTVREGIAQLRRSSLTSAYEDVLVKALPTVLRLRTDSSFSASWANGLLTPETTPLCSAGDSGWGNVVLPFL